MTDVLAAAHVQGALTPVIGRDLSWIVAGYMRRLPSCLLVDIQFAGRMGLAAWLVTTHFDALNARATDALVAAYVKYFHHSFLAVDADKLRSVLSGEPTEALLYDIDPVEVLDEVRPTEDEPLTEKVTREAVMDYIQSLIVASGHGVVEYIDRYLR